MKQGWWLALLLALWMTVPAGAADLTEELREALPDSAARLMDGVDAEERDILGGVLKILEATGTQLNGFLTRRIRGAVSVLVTALLCGVAGGFRQGTGTGDGLDVTLMAGTLTVTMLTIGTLDVLADLGRQTIQEISTFSKVLLPTLAAVTAASGAVGTASVYQVSAVLFADVLLQLIRGLLLPMVYLYVGVLAAGTMLTDGRLQGIAEALKKVVVWMLRTALLLFTLYLSVTKVISGATDSAVVKVTKAAISGAVPVVGGILSNAAETVLAGAGILKGTVGIFGMLAVVAMCIQPFLQLGIQYLLYKLAAFLASVAAPPALCKLINGLATTFGLVLGMTGACALLLLISILAFVAAVTP